MCLGKFIMLNKAAQKIGVSNKFVQKQQYICETGRLI